MRGMVHESLSFLSLHCALRSILRVQLQQLPHEKSLAGPGG